MEQLGQQFVAGVSGSAALVRALSIAVLALTLLACNARTPLADEQPDPPRPLGISGEKWELYTVNSYRSKEPTYAYNPFDKRTEIWLEYRVTLESKARVQLTLTCGQWQLPDGSEGCGQGVLVPNEKVWTRQGVSGEQIWVYSNERPKNGLSATFWHVDSRDAK